MSGTEDKKLAATETHASELTGTLWKCMVCDAFVTIHCERLLSSAVCPACSSGPMQFCASCEEVLEAATDGYSANFPDLIQYPPPEIQHFD